MTTIKIISNPYDKQIKYQRLNNEINEWVDIDYDSNPNSSLLTEELTKGFFPFYVNKIVDTILEEYKDENGMVALTFEGTSDEYNELQLVCNDHEHINKTKLNTMDCYLENARDILPDIISIFKSLNPLISDTVNDRSKVQKELDKFSDASNDIIPICVLGNYSSGKSTFINALVGSEIMPSGDEPVTAKIYKIARSKQNDRANISFSYDDEEINIRFDATSYRFLTGESDKELIKMIIKDLEGSDNDSISDKVHIVLSQINNFENEYSPGGSISDLINVRVPFKGGLWNQSENDFVIFDTPGSNSASNDKHMKVLKKAMEDLSNGLPVFVSEYNTLDSTDNEKLNQEIKSMKELDSRFTMIIVNKADAASLPKEGFTPENINRLLSEAIPRSLFSEGIFFVSSIMGLGSKTNGCFIDEHSSEIFDDQESKYTEPSNKRYKQLYLYDIMPGKQKEHAIAAIQKCEDMLFVNSGLYSVEQEIQVFASKYSSYNKCQQSRLFLGKVIDIVSKEIDLAKKDRERTKKQSEEKLEKDKLNLFNEIENNGDELIQESDRKYALSMEPFMKNIHDMYYQESLEDEQEELAKKQREDLHIDDYEKDFVDSRDNIRKNLWNNVKLLVQTRDASRAKMAKENFVADSKKAKDNRKRLSDINKDMDRNVDDQMIEMINKDFKSYCMQAQEILNDESIKYWSNVAMQVKRRLIQIVTGSNALEDEKKDELSGIIISYQSVDLKKEFNKLDYEDNFKIGNYVIWKSDRINLERLRQSYNEAMEQNVNRIFASIGENHESSVKKWLQKLYQVIKENIVDYNPELKEQQALISRETERIIELEEKQKKVFRYSNEIKQMMEWKQF